MNCVPFNWIPEYKTQPSHVAASCSICDPVPLNKPLWGEYQKYFIAINTIVYTFWCKYDYSVIFLSKVAKCWTSPCTIFQTILQRYGLSKIVIYVYFYGLIKKQMFHNTLFFHIFILKSVCDYCVWYDLKELSKTKKIDLGSYFGL